MLAVFELVMLAGIAYVLKSVANDIFLPVQSLLFMGLLALFGWVAWNYVLDNSDRGAVLKVAGINRK
jgi:hypothetical protein